MHVADEQTYLNSGYDSATIPTIYEAEKRAFTVSSAVGQGLGLSNLPMYRNSSNPIDVRNKGWKKVDEERLKAINKILARPKSEGGLYEVTPKSSEKRGVLYALTRREWSSF